MPRIDGWRVATMLLLLAGTASANSSGISGQSGKQGSTCNSHHAGGAAPVVRLDGPSVVAAGATATFRFTVESQAPVDQPFAGLNVAASGGQLGVIPGQGTQLETFRDDTGEMDELTHTRPRANDASGAASWLFTWRAPAVAGSETLFAAGNSVDGFGNVEGDRAAAVRIDVAIGCLGDCSGNSEVTIDELITAVRLALGAPGLAACALADGNGDGAVQVQELVAAVRSSLEACK